MHPNTHGGYYAPYYYYTPPVPAPSSMPRQAPHTQVQMPPAAPPSTVNIIPDFWHSKRGRALKQGGWISALGTGLGTLLLKPMGLATKLEKLLDTSLRQAGKRAGGRPTGWIEALLLSLGLAASVALLNGLRVWATGPSAKQTAKRAHEKANNVQLFPTQQPHAYYSVPQVPRGSHIVRSPSGEAFVYMGRHAHPHVRWP